MQIEKIHEELALIAEQIKRIIQYSMEKNGVNDKIMANTLVDSHIYEDLEVKEEDEGLIKVLIHDYYQYIESLARSHRMVAHSDTEKHFFRGELEEFYMDLRNRVKFPAVIAESWEITFTQGSKERETSFIIAAAYKESKNWQNIYAALDLCERIGDEFLRRILTDTIRMSCPFNPDPDEDEWL